MFSCLQEADPIRQHDLLPLANLHSLQDLAINSFNQSFYQPLLSGELTRGLTALTHLGLDGCCVSCLTHVSNCVSLKVLWLGCPDGLEEEMGQGEWSAVGELTELVELALFNAKFLIPSRECCAALNKLTKLQSLGAFLWSAEMLPVVASCTQLTKLVGGWEPVDDSNSVGRITVHSVVELAKTHGSPPFAALPNLVIVEQADCVMPDAFISMSRHCTQLRQLKAGYGGTSLPSGGPMHARTAAIKALSALTTLTHLEFMLKTIDEMFLVVDVASALLPHGFKHLEVVVYRDRPMQLSALMHLARLQGLPELLLHVDAATADLIVVDAAIVLSGLSGIRCVHITGLKSDQIDALHAAQAALYGRDLPCPRSLHFTEGP
jgi:hypothetical protein